MIIELKAHCCIVTREPGDPKYYGDFNGAGESRLLFAIKQQLNKTKRLGLIKKRMWKDGHMVDDLQQYLRNKDASICIYNLHWQIRGAEHDFNNGSVTLAVEDLSPSSEQRNLFGRYSGTGVGP